MRAFYYRKREWDYTKCLLQQACDNVEIIPGIGNLSSQLLVSFEMMIDVKVTPFGKLFNQAQSETLQSMTDISVSYLLFRSILLDLLICKEQWIVAVPRSVGHEEDDEETGEH